MLARVAHEVGETSILSRTGGAPTLAVGMASILSGFLGGPALAGIWYHFAILFEALFILTTVDAGTRVCRFMIQDLVGNVAPAFKATESWTNNLIGSAAACAAWGYFLYEGVIDPFGGIWTLWPLFGASNQMLAAIALMLCTVVLFRMKKEKFAWVTIVPATWLFVCTVTAGLEKVANPDPKVGFLAHAWRFRDTAAADKILAPAKTSDEMGRIAFNDEGDDRRSRRDSSGGGMSETLSARAKFVCDMVAQTARLMVGVPDYETYVGHRRTNHPGEAIMTYEAFFRERQEARYSVRKGRFRGCC
jgi:carbon starvation protein